VPSKPSASPTLIAPVATARSTGGCVGLRYLHRNDRFTTYAVTITKRDRNLFEFVPMISVTQFDNESTIDFYSFRRTQVLFGFNRRLRSHPRLEQWQSRVERDTMPAHAISRGSGDMTRLLLSLLSLFFALAALPVEALVLITENNPPFNYEENGKVEGLATALVTEMAKRASLPARFELLPWEEGYTRTQKDRETCLYAVARIDSREKLFHWIGPLAVNRWGIFGKSDTAVTAKGIEDLRQYRVGGVTHDAKLEYLAQYAVTNIRSASDDKLNPARLKLPKDDPNRIDLWITGAYTARKVSRENAGPPLKLVFLGQEIPLYLACSPATPRVQIKALDDALKAMGRDGTTKKIIARYLSKFAQ